MASCHLIIWLVNLIVAPALMLPPALCKLWEHCARTMTGFSFQMSHIKSKRPLICSLTCSVKASSDHLQSNKSNSPEQEWWKTINAGPSFDDDDLMMNWLLMMMMNYWLKQAHWPSIETLWDTEQINQAVQIDPQYTSLILFPVFQISLRVTVSFPLCTVDQ